MVDQTQRAFSLSGSNVGKVRGLGPKDPNYKGTGYGPLIAGNIAEVASVIADDPVGFAKDTAVGVYEEGKDFLSRPIDYSKEVVQEVVESAADLKNKDINARLQEKYGVTFEQATPEQVDDIRQSILSDSMTASGLIPAAGLVGAAAKLSIKNANIDKAMSLGETEGSVFKGKLNLIHGFNPPEDAPDLIPTFTTSEKYGGERYGELDGGDTLGGSYGSTGVYLENPSDPLFFNDPNIVGFYAPKTAEVSAEFNKAFILRPNTIKELEKITGINLKETLPKIKNGELTEKNYLAEEQGEAISKKLKELGYDGLIVKDFFVGDKEIAVFDKYESLLSKIRAESQKKYGKAIPEEGTKERQKIRTLYRKQNRELEKIYNKVGIHPLLTQPQIIHLKPETLKTKKVFPESLQSDPAQVIDLLGTQPVQGEKTPSYLKNISNKVLSKNIPLEIKPSEYGFRQDNPGESYTKTKQKIAEDKAKEYKGEGGSIEKLLTGPITGTMGGNFKKSLFLDTTFLSKIKGANDEVRRSGDIKYEDLKKIVEEKGFDPEQKVFGYDFKPEGIANAISIGVNHKGQAFLLEGNTRVALAKEMDIPSVRAEVKYFNGAEEIDSPYSPKNILKYAEKPKEFNKGGTAMKDQMEMNFGKAETVDPVSGNDVPPGSLPIEVRDDIPARLSEGEYVVPADVVRYYGVKFFEDLRTGAKIGLQQMDADGRIGGEPIEPQQTELSEEDLDSIVQQAMQEQQPIMANEGGVVGYQMPDYLKNKFAGSSVFDYNPTNKPKAADEIIEDAATPTCPPGYTYDKDKKMCMPDASSSFSDGSNDPDEPPTVTPSSSNPWGTTETGELIDFNDPEALEKYVNSFDTPIFDGKFSLESTEGKLASAAGLAVPALGVVAGVAGVAGQLDATRDIAGMKAARISAAIYGHEELVKKIDGIIKEYEGPDGFGSKNFGIGQGYNWSAKAHGLTTREAKEFWELWEDSQKTGATDVTKDALEKLRLKLLEKSRAARKTARTSQKTKVARAEQLDLAKQNKLQDLTYESDRDDSNDRGTYLGTTSPGAGGYEVEVFQPDERTVKPFSGTSRAQNAGGLIQRRKKKK